MVHLLRTAAIYSLGWAIVLAFPTVLPGVDALAPGGRALANGLVFANLAFAYLFWRASTDPRGHREILYAGLLLFGLRGAVGTYEVLYTLEGPAAMPTLVDFVLSLALFVGMLNALPGTLQDRA
jgi:heme A synthase